MSAAAWAAYGMPSGKSATGGRYVTSFSRPARSVMGPERQKPIRKAVNLMLDGMTQSHWVAIAGGVCLTWMVLSMWFEGFKGK
jgi:hypothetical protein